MEEIMCHHHSFPSSRMSIPPERHLFLQRGNGHGDTALVLSTDAKPRLKWTPELHKRFTEAVIQLGGADRDRMSEASEALMSNPSISSQTNKSLPISEALQMQIEVQRRLHEQLEVQRHLQLRIEAQGKYLQAVLEQAQETLGRQNLGSVGVEAAKVQLSELVSNVSTKCLNSAISGLKELPSMCPQQHIQTTQPTDCSMDSCLTSCEGSQKDQEMHNHEMGYLRPYHGNASLEQKVIGKEPRLEQTEFTWCDDQKENQMFLSSTDKDEERIILAVQRSSSDLYTNVGIQEEKWSGGSSFSEGRLKERDEDNNFLGQTNTRTKQAVQKDHEKISKGLRSPCFTAKLDLNTHDENDAASSCKQFDLNGFSWG
ncbi:hypothetical protein HHK36_017580 [Tetracentron sinense]|uniref:MYB-CC type transcription factor LHEQLE-containing domain-containing protein n=1 Tax=Tetracentron sinense TaxID=13715 RepID=A0A834YUK6_TETSI|nr:hypothetical protein HHK36_017580 [Tetracentron sinense]